LLSQILDRGAQAVARGAVRCASQIFGHSIEAVSQKIFSGDATRRQQEKSSRKLVEDKSKYQQLRLYRGKVPLAAMHLRRAGDLAVDWRRWRMF
jgi:hypothetical protein